MGKVYRVDEIINILFDDGWKFNSQEGGHKHFEHPLKKGKVTVPVGNKELGKKTANSILKQAGLKKQ
jgi:predicted RNA binding protein YcfA (HicA-like mRNA interferase family)